MPAGWTITEGQGTTTITAWTGTTGGDVEVDFTDDCGTSFGTYKSVSIGSGGPQPLKTVLSENTFALEVIGETEIKVYPNPAKNVLHILTNTATTRNTTIRILNTLGKEVLKPSRFLKIQPLLLTALQKEFTLCSYLTDKS